jgi:catechol 2,3-dioxygenase-like lactoylglutathione lyase family enzyme
MLSHVTIGISDFPRAFAFYSTLMEVLDLPLRFSEPEWSMAGWQPRSGDRPVFFISHPFDGQAPTPGNGSMTAFLATSREMVDAAYTAALAAGGTCEGPPGPRPHYHPNYYGAYFRDLDGNKLCICCHDAPA